MIVTNWTQVEDALSLFRESEHLAFDIETTGLNPRKDKIIGFGVSDGKNSVYFTHLTWADGQLNMLLDDSQCAYILGYLFTKKLIGWNSSFDWRFVAGYFKISLDHLLPALWADGMLAFHTHNENGVFYARAPFGLKEVAAHYFGVSAKDEQAAMKASISANGGGPNDFYRADLDLMARYCMQDCKLTYDLTFKFLKELKAEGTYDFFLTDEVMPLYREVTIPMEARGLPLDMTLLFKTRTELGDDLKKLEARIQEQLAPHLNDFHDWFYNKEYPARSAAVMQCAALEYAPELPRTDTGSVSFASKGLEKLDPDHVFRALYEGRADLSPATLRKYQIHLHAGQPTFNLSSKDHLKRLFFTKLGCQPLSTTPTGMPQVDDAFLESVKAQYDWVPMLQDYNSLVKLKGTYYDRFYERQEQGVYYPQFFQHRTVSGRYGSDLQQLPRKISEGSEIVQKYTNIIRDLVRAPQNKLLTAADYESLEPHIFAHVAGDEGLKEIFLRGEDFYSKIAIMTEGLTGVSADKSAPNYLGKINKEARQRAKAYCLGIPYGMSGYKLHFQLGCTVEEAEALVTQYLSAFPVLHQWMKNSHQIAIEDGGVMVESGRIRHFPEIAPIVKKWGTKILDARFCYNTYRDEPAVLEKALEARKKLKNLLNNAINIQVQGLAASIVNRAAIAINRRFAEQRINAYICLQIHDELAVLHNEKDLDKVAAIMRECMEQNYKISIPLKAEPKSAECYGDTK